MRIRFFDNIAEALAGQKPGTCTMHETCDSYVVVEYNGDVYPCDFFVEQGWKLGNVNLDSWAEIARRTRRYQFAAKKTHRRIPSARSASTSRSVTADVPSSATVRRRQFDDLDYFCAAYKMIFAKSVGPLKKELTRLGAQRGVIRAPFSTLTSWD